ncbi:hypothetical protein DMC61_19125 [Amycolatopsis sp. WAC 04169]|uniref:Uncharacterized protein n=1 Tax=Amycolatopsis keratiniphila TaxID=129921 RepID=R4SJU3_9PSEU|nr:MULTISPECIES: hypothetical protein [Amycolatopsis]AGM03849.1 hypothetical protein AORI_1260 [Amycolatopsis keratiniphila]RSN30327.1 hypothetical protein DMC61_19125 [Amycolatopsis sp. WAC 04169]
MTWARHSSRPDPADDHSRMAGVRAEEEIRLNLQNARAARTVAGHSSGALDCAELLAMLGLEGVRKEHVQRT